MGRIEKIVVLTVLFLVALILAVSLSQKPEQVAPGGALAAAGRSGALNPTLTAAGKPEGSAIQQPTGALNSAIEIPTAQPNAAAAQLDKPAQPANAQSHPPVLPMTNSAPANSLLKSREGLRESLFPDLYLYAWQPGDSFALLAERFYGAQKLADRIRVVNEGRNETNITVGENIFIPNLEAPTPAPQPVVARADQRVGAQPVGAAGAPLSPGAPTATPVEAGVAPGKLITEDGFYVVQKGDVLGTIAQKLYGTSKKWQKIYDANRDLLKDPNALRVGMKLRIPE